MSTYVHGDNIEQKEKHETKYTDAESKQFSREIREKYEVWKKANIELKGPFSKPTSNDFDIIKQRVKLLNEYKDFIDQQKYAEKFDSRSNLHSTVLEEFMFYLFRDLVHDFSSHALIGKAHTFKDIFFVSSSYREMVQKPNAKVEVKDHDFVIGVNIQTRMLCEGGATIEEHKLQIPAIAIECKTYLDKTMLEGSSTAAQQLKIRNPNAIYIVVAEWLKLTEEVNLRKYEVDQIYILRKQKNTDREFRFLEGYVKNPIYDDVVYHLFDYVRNFLTTESDIHIPQKLERGYLK
jgi:hypothetical protein